MLHDQDVAHPVQPHVDATPPEYFNEVDRIGYAAACRSARPDEMGPQDGEATAPDFEKNLDRDPHEANIPDFEGLNVKNEV